MFPVRINLQVSGERPTRAGPNPCADIPGGSAAGDWPWGGTSVGPRGLTMKWSIRDEPVRCPAGGASSWLTHPLMVGRVAPSGVVVEIQLGRLDGHGACLSASAGKITIDGDRGNSHIVPAGLRSGGGTGRYKLCEIRSRRWWRDGRFRVFWRAQHYSGKAWPMAPREGNSRAGVKPVTEEETAVEGTIQ